MTEATVGERIEFEVEDASGEGRRIDTLEWGLGDGTAASGWYTAHAYDETGSHTASLTATDDAGHSTTDTVEIEITGLSEPLARIEPSTTDASVDQRVEFRVNDTSGEERWIDTLEWELGDGTTTSGWYADHRYEEAGTYTVTLTVTDNTGQSTTDTVDTTVS